MNRSHLAKINLGLAWPPILTPKSFLVLAKLSGDRNGSIIYAAF